jgi:hypothetical protein
MRRPHRSYCAVTHVGMFLLPAWTNAYRARFRCYEERACRRARLRRAKLGNSRCLPAPMTLASSNAVTSPSAAGGVSRTSRLRLTDGTYLLLAGKSIHARQRQIHEKTHPRHDLSIYLLRALTFLTVAFLERCKILETPMCRDRMSWPYRTRFTARLIAHGDDEVHFWRTRLARLVPCFAAEVIYREALGTQ